MAKDFKIPDYPMRFHWGPVVAAHRIGDYMIVEFHPMVMEGNHGTGKYEAEKVEFHAYVLSENSWQDTCHGFESLDSAIVGVIAYKHEGANHRADRYFMKMLGK